MATPWPIPPAVRAGALAALLLGAAGCGGDGTASPVRNVLLVTFDTMRADRLGIFGRQEAHTPVLDSLALAGVAFESCIAAAPITLPSHATILTGLYPFHHGARNNGTHHLPPEVTTLAESLRERGFATGAVVSAVVLDSRFGLDQGFTHYDDDLSNATSEAAFVYRQVNASDTASRAIRWLEELGEERWFLWVHFFDPHTDYTPPERFRALCGGSAYDGEIAYADEELGRILESVRQRGELDSTLVVMTSDHGESLGEHGEATHSLFIYEATTRVPLIFAHPSLEQGRRVRAVVSSADIAPTLLELLDLAPTGKLDGRSLAGILRGQEESTLPAAPAYSEAMAPLFNHGWADLRALRDDRGRYVRAPRPELYDLAVDPREETNLLPAAADSASVYLAALDALVPDVEADARGGDASGPDAGLRESLAELGYFGSGEGASLDEADGLPDPKDKIDDWRETLMAWGMVRQGMQERSLEVFRGVIEKDPRAVTARQGLATALRDLSRFEEALAELRALVALPNAGARSFVLLAEVQEELGDEAWRESISRAKDLDPRDSMPWTREGDWTAESGDPESAASAYRRALELDERDSDAWLGLAKLAHDGGRGQEALEALERAVEADPLSSEAWLNLGVQCEELSRPEQAIEHYRRASELDPKSVLARTRMGNLLVLAQDFAAARKAFEEAVSIEPENFVANYHLGQVDLQEGRFAAACERLATACRLRPEDAEVWRKLMTARRSANDPQGTLEAADRLLGLLPDDPPALMTSAIVLDALGNTALSRARLTRALEIDEERVLARSRRDAELAELLARLPPR